MKTALYTLALGLALIPAARVHAGGDPAPAVVGTPDYGSNFGYWQPGGYENRIGSPYYYRAPAGSGSARGQGADPYQTHFGPGFHRRTNFGHYRFPYYSYRRPWYHPGPPAWARDTNFAW